MSKEKIREQLRRSRRNHLRRIESGLHDEVERLERWQKDRLLHTYADLAAQERYRDATGFFVDELYAPADLSQRDEDLERMYPFMVRMLPEKVLIVVASALELQALTLDLDLQVARAVVDAGTDPLEMTLSDYAAAYQALDHRAVREHQIDLILQVGNGLQRYVHNPMIYASLKMARPLAVMTGLEQLQQFLEHGFSSFRSMRRSEEFLDTIELRERQVLAALFEGRLEAVQHYFHVPVGEASLPVPSPVPVAPPSDSPPPGALPPDAPPPDAPPPDADSDAEPGRDSGSDSRAS